MAYEALYAALRDDIAFPALTNAAAEAIFVEAVRLYTSTAAQHAGARVIAYQRLAAGSAFHTSYTANATKEDLGKLIDNMLKMEALWNRNLEAALKAEVVLPVDSSGPRSTSVPIVPVW